MRLFLCIPDCRGHDNADEALLHGQRHLEEKMGQIMATVEQVAADFDQYKTDVAAAFARLQASIDSNEGTGEALDALDAAIKGADADANAEDPAPVETTPTEGDGSTPVAAGDAAAE